MTRRLVECGCCEAYHPETFAGDCRDDANRINEPLDDDVIVSTVEEQMAEESR